MDSLIESLRGMSEEEIRSALESSVHAADVADADVLVVYLGALATSAE